MGCFNVVCDLTGTQIMSGDEVVLIELARDLSRVTKIAGDRIYGLGIYGLTQSRFSARHTLEGMMETLEGLASELEETPEIAERIERLRALLHRDPDYRVFLTGKYDDYGGVEHEGGVWRPYDDRDTTEENGGRTGYHPYAMMHRAAFESAVTRMDAYDREWASAHIGSRWEFKRERAQELQTRTFPSEKERQFELFLGFCSCASIEPFKINRPYGSQGWEDRDILFHHHLTDIMIAQRARQIAEHAQEDE